MDDAAVLREAERRWGEPPYLADTFPEQRRFIDDTERTIAALCTRRAGKTEGCARKMLKTASRRPRSVSVYIALTRARAKELMLPILLDLNDRHHLGLEVNFSELTIACPNGSTIMLRGADDQRKIERLRGSKLALAIIDEAASFPPSVLATLIREILRPALVDLRGTLCLVGTPGAACIGLFYEATTRKDTPFAVHRWSILDNPHVPHAAEELETEKRINGWTDDSPAYRREWRGEWVRDEQSIVYRYDRAKNLATERPTDGQWRYVLGIDYGVTDSTAYAVWGWREGERTAWLIECWGAPGQTPTESAEQVRDLQKRYDFQRIVGDVGGLGKAFVVEARQRYSLPIEQAQKQNKRAFIEMMNDQLTQGKIRVVEGRSAEWIEEALVCQWDERREKEDARYSNHRLDAALYGWRELGAFAEEAPPPKDERPQEDRDREALTERWLERRRDDEEGVSWLERRFR